MQPSKLLSYEHDIVRVLIFIISQQMKFIFLESKYKEDFKYFNCMTISINIKEVTI